MNTKEKLYVGNIDYSIGMFIKNNFELIIKYPHTIISSIDSSRNLTELTICEEIAKIGCSYQIISGQISLLTKQLDQIEQKLNLFNGFDEVWFFSAAPTNSVPHNFWITGPRDIDIDLPNGLSDWMEENNCKLGFGDGIGLNYVTMEKNIHEYIIENYGSSG